MHQIVFELVVDDSLRRRLRWTGLVLMLFGVAGVLLPQFLSLAISILVGLLLVSAGLVNAYLTWYGYRRSGLAWLKPFILLALGLLILFYPLAGAAALGLVLAVFFLLHAFAGISFALALRPLPGWGWTLLSGLLSLAIAVLFLIGWPLSSPQLVGLFVGIMLLFDGLALLMLAWAADRF